MMHHNVSFDRKVKFAQVDNGADGVIILVTEGHDDSTSFGLTLSPSQYAEFKDFMRDQLRQ